MKEIRRKVRIFVSLLLAFILILSLAACGSDTGSSDASSSADPSASESEEETESVELKTLRIGVNGTDGEYTLEVGALAYKNGYLEEELNAVGYTIEWYGFTGGGTEINAALASGDIDVAIYGDFPAFTCKSNGVDTTIVAVLNQRMQYAILAAGDDITSGSDLEGKNVAIMFGSVQQYFWEKFVEITGIDEDSVSVINSSEASSLLATGSADATAANIYVAAYQADLGLGTVIEYGYNYDIYTTFIVNIIDSLLEEDPDVAVAINKALIRAYEDALEDPEALYEAVSTDTFSADIMSLEYDWDESLWYLSPEFDGSTLEYYEELNAWMYENELTAEEIDIDSFIDTSYYYTALEELEAE